MFGLQLLRFKKFSSFNGSGKKASSFFRAFGSSLQGPEPMYEKIVTGYQTFSYNKEFNCELGGSLPKIDLAYETWGKLNKDKSNAILLHTGLSASSHVKSHPQNTNSGWWEDFVGPGLAVDTNKFFVICTNILGGCYGTTGPSSINPETNKRYAMSFPMITVFDMIKAQFLLLNDMGIEKLHASVGSSLGGMQSLAVAATFPSRVGRIITISSSARTYPVSVAWRWSQRQVLMSDPNWNGGNYYDSSFPYMGMQISRQIGTISYRSGEEWLHRFGRKRVNPSAPHSYQADFEIESYLQHQGERWGLQYDPNSFIVISKAMDLFDLSVEHNGELDLKKGISRIKCPVLVIGIQSDILFPIWQQREIARLLKETGNTRVTHYDLDALYGHDTFLIDVNNVGAAVKGHLEFST